MAPAVSTDQAKGKGRGDAVKGAKGKGKRGSEGKSQRKGKNGPTVGCYTCGGDHDVNGCPNKGRGQSGGKAFALSALSGTVRVCHSVSKPSSE